MAPIEANPYCRAMTRPALARAALRMSALAAGGGLFWFAYKASGLQIFPRVGFIVHINPLVVVLVGLGAALTGMVLLPPRRPQA